MKRIAVGKVVIDQLSFAETIQRTLEFISGPNDGCRQVVTVNAQFVTVAEQEPRLAELIRRSAISIPDGVPLLWVARAFGKPLRGRVNGTELMVRLCEEAAIYGKSVYFFGGRPGAGEITAERMERRYPGLIVAGIDCPEYGFDRDAELDKEASDRINAASPDIVFVALGAPKAEYWIQDHLHLRAKVMIGVGGSFELVGSYTKRAPTFWQKAGCEWLWRLCMEPKRLGKRYLIGNIQFLMVVLRQAFQKQPAEAVLRFESPVKNEKLVPAQSASAGSVASKAV
jgi:N-acetylglucosaminyldiphosphoundecaprenol N-acetyl-beta-D-mannosaminyltransferase